MVGSFAIYARAARTPTADEVQLMDSAAHFASVAIDKHRTQQALRQSEARNRVTLCAIPDLLLLTTPDGVILDYHIHEPSTLLVAPSRCPGNGVSEVIPKPLGTELESAIERVSKSGEQEHLDSSLKGCT